MALEPETMMRQRDVSFCPPIAPKYLRERSFLLFRKHCVHGLVFLFVATPGYQDGLATAQFVNPSDFSVGISRRELTSVQEFNAILKIGTVNIVIRTEDGRDCPNPGAIRWGAEHTCPKSQLLSLSIQYEGRAARIPLSAYSDLSNASLLQANSLEEGFEINIGGGEAATSYRAILAFSIRNQKKIPVLLSRTVRSGPNPKEAYDYFEYGFPSVDAVY